MKRSTYGVILVSFLMATFLPVWSAYGQVSSKKPLSQSLPQVPIAYESDTDTAIIRRAKWIEGAKKEGEFVWWNVKSASVCNQMLTQFNRIYPFIKGTFWVATGEQIATKVEMETQHGRYTVDLVEGGSDVYARWRKMKIMGKFTDIIPDIKKWPPSSYSRYEDWAAYGSHIFAPQYNTNLISKAEAPRNWEDLLDPKWRGQIGLVDDVKVWETLALEAWGIEKTEQFLSKLTEQNLIWAKGHSAGHALVVAGEFKIFGSGHVYNVVYSKAKDPKAPVDFAKVNPIVVSGSNIVQINDCPHPNATKLFLEWLLSPQGLAAFDEISGGQGAVYPGSVTRQAKAAEGLKMVYRTEEGLAKASELGLQEKFTRALGIAK